MARIVRWRRTVAGGFRRPRHPSGAARSLSLLTDPWWSGPAYKGQWYPYPLPVPERYDLRELDAVYISHAHEDHLHRQTLVECCRRAAMMAVIPERYDTSMRDYLRRIGFRRISEVPAAPTSTCANARDAARLRVFTHMDDSLLERRVQRSGTAECERRSACFATRADRRILSRAPRRLPRIDYLFCGFGGASYFPNCIHVPGKTISLSLATGNSFSCAISR